MMAMGEKAVSVYEAIFGKLDLSDFDKRMHFQKTIYLLKYLGFNFSELNFTWFRRGPYCFDLVGIQYKPRVNAIISSDEQTKIQKFKPVITGLMKDSRSAELYSSVAFLQAEEKLSPERIIHRMGLVKPWFTQHEVEEGMEKVSKLAA